MIEVRNLKKSFKDGENITEVLKGIDFIAKSGEFIAIMGRSGAGKSTFLYQMSLLDEPTSGEIFIDQKGTLAGFEEERENLKKFQSTYEIYQANLRKMDQLFVDKEEPVDFIEFLEAEAMRVKLTINLTPLTLKAGKKDVWPSTSFQAEMAGSFPNFLRFLDKIESSPYLLVLSDFSLNKPTKNTNGDIAISFQMKVYTR